MGNSTIVMKYECFHRVFLKMSKRHVVDRPPQREYDGQRCF